MKLSNKTLKFIAGTLLIPLLIPLLANNAHAIDRRGRLGVGMNDQLKVNLPAISFKLQKSKSFAIGGMLAYSTDDNGGGHGAGLKLYRILFDEPQLNFYGALMGAMIKQNNPGNEKSGFQADLTLGSEFSFSGLTSLGFSFEFGVSMNKLDDFVVETVGRHFVVSAIHFYL